jgi:hypothetical protein
MGYAASLMLGDVVLDRVQTRGRTIRPVDDATLSVDERAIIDNRYTEHVVFIITLPPILFVRFLPERSGDC